MLLWMLGVRKEVKYPVGKATRALHAFRVRNLIFQNHRVCLRREGNFTELHSPVSTRSLEQKHGALNLRA